MRSPNSIILLDCDVIIVHLPIDGRTIATGKLPASSSSICSVSAFVNVYVFGRLPIRDGVNCSKNTKKTFSIIFSFRFSNVE